MKEQDILIGRGINPASILGRRLIRGQTIKVKEEVIEVPKEPKKVKVYVTSKKSKEKTYRTR